MTKTELFGGYINCDIPNGYEDLSKFMEIPDNQEVLENIDENISVIIEILEKVDIDDQNAALFHFKEIVLENGGFFDEFKNKSNLSLSKQETKNSHFLKLLTDSI